MRETLEWTSPFGHIGRMVDALTLEYHLHDLVSKRHEKVKKLAEASAEILDPRQFLPNYYIRRSPKLVT